MLAVFQGTGEDANVPPPSRTAVSKVQCRFSSDHFSGTAQVGSTKWGVPFFRFSDLQSLLVIFQFGIGRADLIRSIAADCDDRRESTACVGPVCRGEVGRQGTDQRPRERPQFSSEIETARVGPVCRGEVGRQGEDQRPHERPQYRRLGGVPREPPLMARNGRYEVACYGLRSRRIGEASHPGPSLRQRVAIFRSLILACGIAGLVGAWAHASHRAATGDEEETFAQSHRSRQARLQRRLVAREQQWKRAAFEIHGSISPGRVSRGTCKLLMQRRGWHPGAIEQSGFSRQPREVARYGLRARRIGEASKPGPPWHRRQGILEELHRTDFAGHQASEYLPSDRHAAARPAADAREAARMLALLAKRTHSSTVPTQGVPRAILRQRWSAINVPLMWAAATSGPDTHPIIDWTGLMTANAAHVRKCDGDDATIADAMRSGFLALRSRFRAQGIDSEEALAQWLREHRFCTVQPGAYIGKAFQEDILSWTTEEDVTVANLEVAYVSAAMHLSQQVELANEILRNTSAAQRRLQTTRADHETSNDAALRPRLTTARSASQDSGGAQPSAAAWGEMAAYDLEAELTKPVRTVREPPRWFRASMRQAFGLALRAYRQRPEAAWKLFVLIPRMLLRPTDENGEIGKAIFFERMRRFQSGDWAALLHEAAADQPQRTSKALDGEAARNHRREGAERKVRMREISRARTLLTSNGLAPGDDATLSKLTDRELRPRQLSQEIPAAALAHQPSHEIELEADRLTRALRTAGRGSAQDLAGMRYEHLRVLLEDDGLWELFRGMAQDFARAKVPEDVMQALRLGRMTALRKKEGGVRGIVAGSILRRLVCKTVAAQFGDHFLARTSPFQFALQTKAGTDALAHAIRFLTDQDEHAVVVSLDGIGAFDHVRRAAFFSKLHECEELQCLLPLVSALYGSDSRFLWENDAGEKHWIPQGEGGEQGCPLMPALFALAQHDALVRASEEMLPDEYVFSFLDDLYIVASKARAAEAYEHVAWHVEQHAGVQSHAGKLKAWCKAGGPPPDDLRDISEEAWTADQPDEHNGIVILGIPLGTAAFVKRHAAKRMESENKFLQEMPLVSDCQTAWTMLAFSAVPRANHTIRTLPPTQSSAYAKSHDDALWECFCAILGAQEHADDMVARMLSTLPASEGGIGLRSAQRIAQAAYWASWVDALPVLAAKAPGLAARIVADLVRDGGPTTVCLQEAALASSKLRNMGADMLPSWQEALQGIEAPQPQTSDDIETSCGWQWYASSVCDSFFAERVLLPLCESPRRAMRLSQGGTGGAWLRSIPPEHAFELRPLRFQVAMRRRLRWPLPLTKHRCRGRACRQAQDEFGDHPASCPLSGLLKLRSRPIEKTWARIVREGGARVRENVSLHDAGVPVDPQDGRAIEVVVTGLPLDHGIPIAVDATMVSPLHSNGTPYPAADARPGVALERGRREKLRTYPELASSPCLRLRTAGVETGGRLAKEGLEVIEHLAEFRARSEPQVLRRAAARAWRSRWVTMLSVACQDALAATLVDDGVQLLDSVSTGSPLSVDVWLDEA